MSPSLLLLFFGGDDYFCTACSTKESEQWQQEFEGWRWLEEKLTSLQNLIELYGTFESILRLRLRHYWSWVLVRRFEESSAQ